MTVFEGVFKINIWRQKCSFNSWWWNHNSSNIIHISNGGSEDGENNDDDDEADADDDADDNADDDDDNADDKEDNYLSSKRLHSGAEQKVGEKSSKLIINSHFDDHHNYHYNQNDYED